MIITVLNGGLGNQLFQYAAGRQLAFEHQTECIVDLRFYDNNYRAEFSRPPLLERMGLRFKHRDFAVNGNRNSLLRRIKRKLLLLKYHSHQHMDLKFDPTILKLPNWTLLMGLYQSENYFRGVADELRQQLALEPLLAGVPQSLITGVQHEQSVALHIRRTDYLDESRFMLVNLERYYRDSIAFMQQQLSQPHFYIFSDDIQWCRDFSPVQSLGQSKTLVELENSLIQPERELALMASCKHQIIANSTFSWWGAWLNSNPDKKVTYPKLWFAGIQTDQAEICPSAWHSINNEII